MAGASRTRAWWLAAGLGACALYVALGVGPALAPRHPAAVRDEPGAARAPDLLPLEPNPQLDALLLRGNRALDLNAMLDALQADPTLGERDRRWQARIERLADQIEREALIPAMDLLVAETRPRARRALYSAYALLAISERTDRLPQDARQTLINHFIDGWPALPEAQRPEIEQALRKLAGDDVADIMNGKGLATDDALQLTREREQALEESSRALSQ